MYLDLAQIFHEWEQNSVINAGTSHFYKVTLYSS